MEQTNKYISGPNDGTWHPQGGVIAPVPGSQAGNALPSAIHDALISAGVPDPGATFAVMQSYYETGGWPGTYALYWQHNNGSGIKYAGQSGAKKGQSGYAYFDTWNDWIRSFSHELLKGASPGTANNLDDYNTRLKANGYYGANMYVYLDGLKKANEALYNSGYIPHGLAFGTGITPATMAVPDPYGAPDYSGQFKGNVTPPGDSILNEIEDWWKHLATWKKVVGIGVVAIVILKK